MSLVRPVVKSIVSSPVSSVVKGIVAAQANPASFVRSALKTTVSASTTYAIITPTGTAQDNLLLAFVSVSSNVDVTKHDDWTTIGVLNGGAGSVGGLVFAKIATASDSAVSYDFTSSNSASWASRCFEITNWSGNLNNIQASLILAAGTTDTKTCPELTPAGGNQGRLWIAAMAMSSSQTINSYPTNYINTDFRRAGTTTAGAQLATGTRELTSTSESPGSFVLSSALAVDTVMMTIAILGKS